MAVLWTVFESYRKKKLSQDSGYFETMSRRNELQLNGLLILKGNCMANIMSYTLKGLNENWQDGGFLSQYLGLFRNHFETERDTA